MLSISFFLLPATSKIVIKQIDIFKADLILDDELNDDTQNLGVEFDYNL